MNNLLDDIDLDDILSQAEIDAAIREGKKKLTHPEEKPQPDPKIKVSPWHCTAAILVMQRVTCKCGEQYTAPAAKTLLAHFDHKRDKNKIWEIVAHPSTINPNLPRQIRWMDSSVEVCPACYLRKELVVEMDMEQVEEKVVALFQDLENHPGLQ